MLRYIDHILFRASKPSNYFPCIREAVGRIKYENDEFIKLFGERSISKLPMRLAIQKVKVAIV